MGLFLENRLKILLILLVFIFVVYTTSAVLEPAAEAIKMNNPDGGYPTDINVNIKGNYTEGETPEDTAGLNDIFDTFGNLFKFFTFQFMDMPEVIMLFMTFVMGIVATVTIFIVVSVVYDIIKALPFT